MQLCILNLFYSIVQHWGCEDTNLKHRTSNISQLFAKGHLTIQSVLRTDSIHCYYYLQALKYIGILFSASSNLLSFTWFFLVFCLERGNNNSCKILREREASFQKLMCYFTITWDFVRHSHKTTQMLSRKISQQVHQTFSILSNLLKGIAYWYCNIPRNLRSNKEVCLPTIQEIKV